MQYTMKLFEKPYRDLEQGKKTIELRLCDKKRDSIREGDIIIFYLYGKADSFIKWGSDPRKGKEKRWILHI